MILYKVIEDIKEELEKSAKIDIIGITVAPYKDNRNMSCHNNIDLTNTRLAGDDEYPNPWCKYSVPYVTHMFRHKNNLKNTKGAHKVAITEYCSTCEFKIEDADFFKLHVICNRGENVSSKTATRLILKTVKQINLTLTPKIRKVEIIIKGDGGFKDG